MGYKHWWLGGGGLVAPAFLFDLIAETLVNAWGKISDEYKAIETLKNKNMLIAMMY